ncbi:hypothetical protein MTsPCn5_36260 [Croceitalea sp. MTPC5]|uniref:hypothetical protein n=1 Tax=Croceitalea sp. MTPC5 TaxID=3056565 RepID=UPI002B36FFE7|nr:hypothetical protein MTsPCn5_36260 [Croceitalea sp. MTPC5]
MKTVLTAILVLFISISTYGQVDRSNFRAGLNAGIVVGDFADFSSFSIGVDIVHHWGISREIDLGFATGFSNAFGEDQTVTVPDITLNVEVDDIQFVPMAGSIRIYPSKGFKLGGDVGYAIGINSGNGGGLYYRPVLGVDVNGVTELNISYFNVSDDINYSSLLFGLLFLF